nr:hypothetical protein [Saprospiraceae bacterium]
MKHFFILFLSLFVNVIGAQEQITDIVGNGTSENYAFHEYLDKKYMLSFDKFDNVTTYEMTDESLNLLHTRKIEGGKEVIIGKTTGKFLLLENGSASIAYNFVDDEVKYFEYGIGVEKGSW